jgi:single-stranded-DNA-specific exonuclease
MIRSLFTWRLRERYSVDDACRALARERGVSDRLLEILAGRGIADAPALASFLAPAAEGLHDPRLLPDAEQALARVKLARDRGERVLVYGDFDADGLTGLSILVIALRRIGVEAEPYVPERLGDGHGLSMKAVEQAAAEGRTLILTADCGTSSGAEIVAAAARRIDVIVTDHHHAAEWPAAAIAVVNPRRADATYPEPHLTGAGVAWKFATLLLSELGEREAGGGAGPEAVRAAPVAEPKAPRPAAAAANPLLAAADLADLALVGTVADVAPMLGENRAIARLGLERLRTDPRPGIAALLAKAGVAPKKLDLEDVGFVVAPRLNAAGRVGEAARAARLLLAEDRAAADTLAAEIDQANLDRREMTRTALAEARGALGLLPPGEGTDAAVETALPPALLIVGEWPVGIIGLVAGRLAEDTGRAAIVATVTDPDAGLMRGSCRAPAGFGLAEALIQCADLLVRHGGHSGAAGFDIEKARWPEFAARFTAIALERDLPSGPPELAVDLVVPADAVDYDLVREMAILAPTGPGNPPPLLAITGLRVVRVRAANGGHTQLVLGRGRDVLDGIAFRRADLPAMLHEGDRVDVVGQASSRSYGGYESIQLLVTDVAAEGAQAVVQRH